MLACIQICAALAGMLFLGMCPALFFFNVSLRSKSVRLMITVSVNISNCLNRVCITVPDSFPVRILESASV